MKSLCSVITSGLSKERMETLVKFGEVLKQRSTQKALLFSAVVLLFLHFVIKFEQIRDHGDYRSLTLPVSESDLSKYPPLGITKEETFPTSGETKIPKIIHQTWKDTQIPRKFVKWIQSWRKNNPDWEYWLWTDKSARQLIAERHPSILNMYDNYNEGIRRADALRYVILYEFGGVYADMDMESLKSLDPIARKYGCFVPQEPYEHPILYNNFEHLIINALLACRARHPFMKKLIDNLEFYSHMWDVLDSTGPHFLTSTYKQYKRVNNISDISEKGVYVTPAEYFFPTIDPSKHFWFRMQCSKFDKLTAIQQRACVSLKYYGPKRAPLPMSFADHHWVHTYLDFRVSLKGPIDIYEIVPEAQIYPNVSKLHR